MTKNSNQGGGGPALKTHENVRKEQRVGQFQSESWQKKKKFQKQESSDHSVQYSYPCTSRWAWTRVSVLMGRKKILGVAMGLYTGWTLDRVGLLTEFYGSFDWEVSHFRSNLLPSNCHQLQRSYWTLCCISPCIFDRTLKKVNASQKPETDSTKRSNCYLRSLYTNECLNCVELWRHT